MKTLEIWHAMLRDGDMSRLDEVLAENCVFFSPIVHTPQEGKELTKMYLNAAGKVLGEDFHYAKEVVTDTHAVLEFVSVVDGIKINGVDIMTFDDDGKIVEFKVMVRPLKAINLLHQQMMAMLEQLKSAEGEAR